jgi:hypothetical protein
MGSPRARLRALWSVWTVGVRTSLGAFMDLQESRTARAPKRMTPRLSARCSTRSPAGMRLAGRPGSRGCAAARPTGRRPNGRLSAAWRTRARLTVRDGGPPSVVLVAGLSFPWRRLRDDDEVVDEDAQAITAERFTAPSRLVGTTGKPTSTSPATYHGPVGRVHVGTEQVRSLRRRHAARRGPVHRNRGDLDERVIQISVFAPIPRGCYELDRLGQPSPRLPMVAEGSNRGHTKLHGWIENRGRMNSLLSLPPRHQAGPGDRIGEPAEMAPDGLHARPLAGVVALDAPTLPHAPGAVGVPVGHRGRLSVQLAPAPDRFEDLLPGPDDAVSADPPCRRRVAGCPHQVSEPSEVVAHLREPRPRPGALEALGEVRAAAAPCAGRVPVDDAWRSPVLGDPAVDGRNQASVLDRDDLCAPSGCEVWTPRDQ